MNFPGTRSGDGVTVRPPISKHGIPWEPQAVTPKLVVPQVSRVLMSVEDTYYCRP